MNFIKKILDKDFDNSVHLQFQKFSRGIFKNKAIVKVKKSKKLYTINTSAEFANELVTMMAEKLGEHKTKITGAVISTNDLTNKLDFKEKNNFKE